MAKRDPWLYLSPDWRSVIATWPEVMQERHRAEAERLMDLDKPWNRNAAEFLAFSRLEEAAKAALRAERDAARLMEVAS